MKKTLTYFALGFVAAHAIPVSRAFITGMNMSIARAKREEEEKIATINI